MNPPDTDVNSHFGSGRRARKAASTRRAIREAAEAAFLARGYGATTMRQVAADAGVGERTLYDAFGSKEALFGHVVDVAVGGDELPVSVAQRPATAAALAEPDPRRAVAQYAAQAAAILERAAPLIMVAVESSGAEPALRAFTDRGAAATRRFATTFVGHLADIHPIRDPDTAAATLLALASPHVHQILRTQAGMDADGYRTWLTDVLTDTLLAPTSRPALSGVDDRDTDTTPTGPPDDPTGHEPSGSRHDPATSDRAPP